MSGIYAPRPYTIEIHARKHLQGITADVEHIETATAPTLYDAALYVLQAGDDQTIRVTSAQITMETAP